MYRDIFVFEVMQYIKTGQVVNVTDRQKGETLYVNGMNVHEFAELIMAAESDETNSFKFYVYERKEASNGNQKSA